MAIDIIGFAIAQATAQQRGVEPTRSTRIGIFGALAGSPVAAFAIGRTLADRELDERPPERPPSETGAPPVTGTGAPPVTGTGAPPATGTGAPPVTGTGVTIGDLSHQVSAATALAVQAQDVANNANAKAQTAIEGVAYLEKTVDARFKAIDDKLSASQSPQQAPEGAASTKGVKGSARGAGSD